MEQEPTTRAGVLSASVDSATAENTAAAYAPTDCQECAGRSGIGYAVCRDCLESLPDGICTSCVLGALVR